MSAIWRAVAAWFAGAFHFRRAEMVQPWNAISVRALSEDLHLPFEAYSLAPTPTVTAATPAAPVAETTPAPAETPGDTTAAA